MTLFVPSSRSSRVTTRRSWMRPCSYSDHGSRRGPVPVSSQQHTHRERRVVLLSFNPFNHAAASDFARGPHADALHYGARTHVVTERARHHGLHPEDVERKRQPGAPDLRRVAAPPELAP